MCNQVPTMRAQGTDSYHSANSSNMNSFSLSYQQQGKATCLIMPFRSGRGCFARSCLMGA